MLGINISGLRHGVVKVWHNLDLGKIFTAKESAGSSTFLFICFMRMKTTLMSQSLKLLLLLTLRLLPLLHYSCTQSHTFFPLRMYDEWCACWKYTYIWTQEWVQEYKRISSQTRSVTKNWATNIPGDKNFLNWWAKLSFVALFIISHHARLSNLKVQDMSKNEYRDQRPVQRVQIVNLASRLQVSIVYIKWVVLLSITGVKPGSLERDARLWGGPPGWQSV